MHSNLACAERRGKAEGIAEGIGVGKAEGMAEGIAAGKLEGIEVGKAEGERKSKIEIAKNMLQKNLEILLIQTLTGLSAEEIRQL